MNHIIYLFKAYRASKFKVVPIFSTFFTKLYLRLNGAKYATLHSVGMPHIHISKRGVFEVGEKLVMINWIGSSASGLKGKCRIEVRNGAELKIGKSLGMTLTTIVCHEKITIGNYVNLGVGVHVYDTDFHTLDWKLRRDFDADVEHKNTAPIIIEDDVFVGAQAIILKGVTIGARSVIGAGSVVTKNIPADVIAAGNPCRVIRSLIE